MEKFRGMLVSHPLVKGVFWGVVEIDSERSVQRPWLRREVVIERPEVGVVEFRQIRLPLWWTTDVRFLAPDGGRIGKIFSPIRWRRLQAGLEQLGWRVELTRWP